MLNKSCTTILAGFLVLSGAATAMAACGAGDLTGGWSMYGLAINPSAPFMMRCAVRLDKATTQPIAYSISGQCRLYSTTDPSEVFTARHGDVDGKHGLQARGQLRPVDQR
jgi:hypothetical protein